MRGQTQVSVTDKTNRAIASAMTAPISIETENDLEKAIDEHVALTRIEVLKHRDDALIDAVADAEVKETVASTHRGRLTTAETRLAGAEHGSLPRTIIGLTGTAATFMAEYYLSWLTLPYLVGVRPASMSGALVALAPPASVAILDILLLHMLEEPWHRLKAQVGSRARLIAWTIRTLCFVTVLAGNLYMINVVAEAREESLRIKTALASGAGDTVVTINREVVHRAIQVISLVAAIDSAIFLLFSLQDARLVTRCATAALSVAARRRRQARLDTAHRRAEAQRDIRTRDVAAAPVVAAHVAEVERRVQLARLKLAVRRDIPSRSWLDRVTAVRAGDLTVRDAARRSIQ